MSAWFFEPGMTDVKLAKILSKEARKIVPIARVIWTKEGEEIVPSEPQETSTNYRTYTIPTKEQELTQEVARVQERSDKWMFLGMIGWILGPVLGFLFTCTLYWITR